MGRRADEYQVQFKNGIIKKVSELTLKECQRALCNAIDVIEKCDARAQQSLNVIDLWRVDA